MQPTNIVLLQSDPSVAEMLTASLSNSFHGVHIVASVNQLRHAIVKHRPYAVVVDLESATLAEVAALKHEFAGIRVICNHRVADEVMWTRTLSIGADDCCPSSDMNGILLSAVSQTRNAHGAAA